MIRRLGHSLRNGPLGREVGRWRLAFRLHRQIGEAEKRGDMGEARRLTRLFEQVGRDKDLDSGEITKR